MGSGDDAPIIIKSWTARDYILAALGACLAATAIVIIASVVLSPGRIIFSVIHASHKDTADGGLDLTLTILANNTSHRTKVNFLSFFVVLSNGTSSTGKFKTSANVVQPTFPYPGKKDYLSAPGSMNIIAEARLLKGDMVSSFTGQRIESGNSGLTVLLTAEVKFKIRVVPTKIYDIKVSCPRVTFVQQRKKSLAEPVFPCAG